MDSSTKKMKKKILLLVYENECEHTLWIGNKLKDNGHEVNLIICDFYSFYGGQDYVLKKCYDNGYEKKSIFNIRDELIEINKCEQDDSINIDWDFLINFEKKLKQPFIMNSVYTDFAFNNIYNPRDYVFVPRNKDIMVKLIELLCKKINSTDIDSYDLIYSASTTCFCRNIIANLAENLNIPIISLTQRFYKITFLQDTYFKKTPQYFEDILEVDKLIKKFSKNYLEKKKDINNYWTLTFKKFLKNIFQFLKDNYKIHHIIKEDIKNRINFSRANYFYTKLTLYVKYTVIRDIFRNYLIFNICKKNLENKLEIIKSRKFIYFPLHLVPETGVMNQKNFFDEYFLIQKVSKLLPLDYYLVVKPNPYAFNLYMNQYPVERYKKIDIIPNVVLVSPDINHELLLKRCKAVVTVSGSSSLEALFYKKPGFLFSNTEFSSVNGIHLFNEETFFKIINEYNQASFDDSDFKSYMANVVKWGIEELPENIIYSSKSKITNDHNMNLIHKKIVNILEEKYLK